MPCTKDLKKLLWHHNYDSYAVKAIEPNLGIWVAIVVCNQKWVELTHTLLAAFKDSPLEYERVEKVVGHGYDYRHIQAIYDPLQNICRSTSTYTLPI